MPAVIAVPVESTLPTAGNSNGVSWAAIFAGAAAAAALSLILLVLGTGLGLAAMSPWASSGASAKALSWSTIAWLVFTALAASGLGGYLAGRLRAKWSYLNTDEAYFRDTAHGFLAWAVATLLTAAVLTSAVGTIAGIGAAGVGAAGATAVGTAADDSGYTVDSLFRPSPTATAAVADPGLVNQTRGEVARIFANNIHTGQLSQQDTTYVGQLVAQRTGMSQQEAETRVNQIYSAAKQLADEARKNAAYASLWVFVSLLGGAFFASLMAPLGGRRRDLY